MEVLSLFPTKRALQAAGGTAIVAYVDSEGKTRRAALGDLARRKTVTVRNRPPSRNKRREDGHRQPSYKARAFWRDGLLVIA